MGKIVIIGNGISGVTVARHIRKNSDNEILIISGETEHFFSRTALMYLFMGHMRFKEIKPYEDYFWEKNRIDLKFDFVEKIEIPGPKSIMEVANRPEVDELCLGYLLFGAIAKQGLIRVPIGLQWGKWGKTI